MKIMIGGRDYTSALDAAHPLTIERKLNQPSVCRLWIALPPGIESAIARNQSVRITGDDCTLYFTGYVGAMPLPEYAGLGTEGPRYRIEVHAVSDEFLLDQAGISPARDMAGMAAGPLIAALVAKTGTAALSTEGLSLDAQVSGVKTGTCPTFSAAAGSVADQARSAYRALNGTLQLAALPSAIHSLSEADGSLQLESLAMTSSAKRTLANDITVCGRHEPTTYVTEYFLGDGITSQFYLSDRVFAPSGSDSILIRELFNEGQIDPRVWRAAGAHGYFALGAGGLQMQGGTGRDGETQIAWMDPVEMGGTLLLEGTGITLSNGSSGILAGFFAGDNVQSACIAAFRVTAEPGSGNVSIQPLVQGFAAGAAYHVSPSKQYTLRLRVHCPEWQRTTAVYRSIDDSGVVAVGGDSNTAPADLQFEIQEIVNNVAGMPVTLFEGRIANLPATCTAIAASSINLYGSMRGFYLTNLGTGWVSTTPVGGTSMTRRIGSAVQSAECTIEDSGRLVFYPGLTPSAGERIAVSYRTVGRAVGRAVNIESQNELAQSGLPPVSAWVGSVATPAARSSLDCRNAASAFVGAGASVSALWNGTYKCSSVTLTSDVWPGDALAIDAPSAGLDAQVIIRSVKLSYRASLPDLVLYEISFANDWAQDLAIRTSSEIPSDASLPAQGAPTYSANLSGLAVVSITGNSVTIDVGTTAPEGGGFEIRRRDNCFMPGNDGDLVLRSSQSTMTILRSTPWDRFFVRQFDGANPPNYSEFSASLIFNLPFAS